MKWLRFVCEIMKKTIRLEEELKMKSPCLVIMSRKIISWPSKLCRDGKMKRGSRRSRKHYRWKNHRSIILRCRDGR